MRLRLSLLTGAVLISALGPHAALAQSSGYVPLSDPAYHELDALVGAGLVQEAILGQKPYSRVAFARLVREARTRANAGEGAAGVARVAEALVRLEARFAREAAWLCAEDGTCPGVEPLVRVTEARTDFNWADSPGREIGTNYRDDALLDATLNPLLQANGGRHLVEDGWTHGLETQAELDFGGVISVVARPRARLTSPRGGTGRAHVALKELYLRGAVGPLALDVGRVHAILGHGRTGGALLSRNPRALDMVRISTEQSLQLPGALGAIGPMAVSALLADMGQDPKLPGSKLVVLKGSARPHPSLELGGMFLNHQASPEDPNGHLERWQDFVLWMVPGYDLHRVSDKVVGIDVRLTLPHPGIDAYLEWTATDVNLDHPAETLQDMSTWIAGLRVTRLDGDGRGTVWVEAHRSGVLPYVHHQFRSGLTVDGQLLGDPLGPLSTGVAVGYEWFGSLHGLAFTGTWTEHGGDEYRINREVSGERRLEVTSDNPDETRLRGEVEWSRQDGAVGLRPWVRLGVERVTRFDFTDEDRTNAVVQVGLSYLW